MFSQVIFRPPPQHPVNLSETIRIQQEQVSGKSPEARALVDLADSEFPLGCPPLPKSRTMKVKVNSYMDNDWTNGVTFIMLLPQELVMIEARQNLKAQSWLACSQCPEFFSWSLCHILRKIENVNFKSCPKQNWHSTKSDQGFLRLYSPGEKVTVFLLFSGLSSAGLRMGMSPSVELETVSSTKGQLKRRVFKPRLYILSYLQHRG